MDRNTNSSETMMKFRSRHDNTQVKESITYNQLLDRIESEDGEDCEKHITDVHDLNDLEEGEDWKCREN